MESLNYSSSGKRHINEAVSGSSENISPIKGFDTEFDTLKQFNVELSRVISSSREKCLENPAENIFSREDRVPIKSNDQPKEVLENPLKCSEC